MSKGKQATLFQSWGQRKKDNSVDQARLKTGPEKEQSRYEHFIDLCDDFDDNDDELAQAVDATLHYEDIGPSTSSYGSFKEPQNVDLHNISLGAESISDTPGLSQIAAPEGFDKTAGKLWIYPTNYPVRDYQHSIVQQALLKNTLVTLPTGLGKTFIASVVMYNFYRWYPQGKVVFMAPTKPLVAQQIEACYKIMGIPQSDTAEMTGTMPPTERRKAWHNRRVFFLTPQVLTNDLSRGTCPAENMKCLVIDEAHKAQGNHAYCQVVRELIKHTREFRVLALSATPGTDIKSVQQVLVNLLISHIELRTEDSPDIKQYSHERKVEKIVVPLGDELNMVKKKYIQIMDVVVSRLKRQGVLYNRDTTSLSKFLILKAREGFRQNPPQRMPQSQYGVMEGDFALAMSLFHGFELLQLHGLRSLYNFLEGIVNGEKGYGRTRTELTRNADFNDLMGMLQEKFAPSRASQCTQGGSKKPFVTGHPKMQKLQDVVLDHFETYCKDNSIKTKTDIPTRIMIFSQYRDSVNEITDMLKQHWPVVKAMSFIGQSSAGKSSKGLTQKEQLMVMKKFREGGFNTLVSTCVGEEGLDIGEVDLIICFDAHKSPIRLVQRMGRTGRKRQGRIIMLVTEGKEEQIYNQSQYSKTSIHKAIKNGAKSLQFYQSNPRMVPSGWTPSCHKMYITVNQAYKPSKPVIDTETKAANKMSKAVNTKDNTVDEDTIITEMEYEEVKANLVPALNIRLLPDTSKFLSLGEKYENEGTEAEGKLLSLNEWIPWQNRLHPKQFIDHSNMTKHFVDIVQFIELQQALDPDEDNYGHEMRQYLNTEDVLFPKTSEASGGSGIRKFCVSTDMTKVDKEQRVPFPRRKKIRRSEKLPNFESEDESKDEDEDLPVMNFNQKDKTGEDCVPRTSVFLNPDMEQEIERKRIKRKSTVCNRKSMTTNSKSDISRKSCEQNLDTSVGPKKRNKVKRSPKLIEVIAETDNNDFFEENEEASFQVFETNRNTDKEHSVEKKENDTENEMDSIKIVAEECQNEDVGQHDTEMDVDKEIDHCHDENKDSSFSNLLYKIEGTDLQKPLQQTVVSSDEEYICIKTPPPIEEVAKIVNDLSKVDSLPPIDLLELTEEWERENRRMLCKLSGKGNLNDSGMDTLQHVNRDRVKLSVPVQDFVVCRAKKGQSLNQNRSYIVSADLETMHSKKLGDDELSPLLKSHDVLQKELSKLKKSLPERKSTKSVLGIDVNTSNYIGRSGLVANNESNSLEMETFKVVDEIQSAPGNYSKIDKNNSHFIHSDNFEIKKSQDIKDPQQTPVNVDLDGIESVQVGAKTNENISDLTNSDDICVDEDEDVNEELHTQINFNLDVIESVQEENQNSNMINSDAPAIDDDCVYEDGDINEEFHTQINFNLDVMESLQDDDKNSHAVNTDSPTTNDDCINEDDENDDDIEEALQTQINFGLDVDFHDYDEIDGEIENLKNLPNHIDQSANASLFDDSFSDIISVRSKTPVKCGRDVESQFTFTQALHCIHDSEETQESQYVEGKSEVSEDIAVSGSDRTNKNMKLNSGSNTGTNVTDFESVEQQMSDETIEEEEANEDEDIELPQFDLGFDIDEDIIPPSPCASQSFSQKSFSKCVSQKTLKSKKSLALTAVQEINDQQKCDVTENKKCSNYIDKNYVGDKFDTDKDNDNNIMIMTANEGNSVLSPSANIKTSLIRDGSGIEHPPAQSDRDSLVDSFHSSPRNSRKRTSPYGSPHSDLDDSIIITKKHKKRVPVIVSPMTQENILESRDSSVSDNSFEVRRKQKKDVFYSPPHASSEVVKNKTPVRPILLTKAKEKSRSISSSSDEVNRKGNHSKFTVSFNLPEIVSDDDDFEFDLSKIKKGYKDKLKEKANVKCTDKQQSGFKSESVKRQTSKKGKVNPRNAFIEDEAEVSEDEEMSSDDERGDLDHYEDSFIGEATQLSQKSHEDMQAMYLKSIKSPINPVGKFRLKYGNYDMDVFSQAPPEEESQYMEDSFCVESDYEDTCIENFNDEVSCLDEVTQLDLSDVSYVGRRTRWSKPARKIDAVKKNQNSKRRRIKMMADSSSEDECSKMDTSSHIPERNDKRVADKKNQRKIISSSGSSEDGGKSLIESVSPKKGSDVDSDYIPSLKSRMGVNFNLDNNFSNTKDCSVTKCNDLSRKLSPGFSGLEKTSKTVIMVSDEAMTEKKKRLQRQREKQQEFKRKLAEKQEMNNSTSNAKGNVQYVSSFKNEDSIVVEGSEDFLSNYSRSDPSVSKKPVILVDSREINGSQDIISVLRFQHDITVEAAQLQGCDYIISKRMGVDRKQWCEFSNGANRDKLTERIQMLCKLYDRPCLILEKDRVKEGEKESNRPPHWTRYVDKTLANLISCKVTMYFTENQKETAMVLAELCKLEQRKNYSIAVPCDINEEKQSQLKFYLSIPNVTYVIGLHLCHNFKNISEFLGSGTIGIRKKGCMSQERALEIHNYLRRTFDPNLLPT